MHIVERHVEKNDIVWDVPCTTCQSRLEVRAPDLHLGAVHQIRTSYGDFHDEGLFYICACCHSKGAITEHVTLIRKILIAAGTIEQDRRKLIEAEAARARALLQAARNHG